ncbi:MAG TPA: plastocyanin/azurin family copper-binding protein [Solirubrobacteraceae bacterium]|nr:plastocyanin/azurin family copper-binding protein [Solirubrobacteraceae bacterium]
MAGAWSAALTTALTLAACGGSSPASSSGTSASPSGAATGTTSTSGSPTTAASSTTQQPGAAPGAASSKLSLSADPTGQLRFNTSTLQTHAGAVTIAMHNPSQLSHSIAIEGNGVNTPGEVVGPGGTSTVSATLKPGTYKFYCTVPGHRQAGMEGTLTVK